MGDFLDQFSPQSRPMVTHAPHHSQQDYNCTLHQAAQADLGGNPRACAGTSRCPDEGTFGNRSLVSDTCGVDLNFR